MKGFGLYIFPVFFLNVCSSALLSQTPDAPVEKRTFEYFDFVSIPQFKGGDSAAIRFFSEHIRCPRKVLFFSRKGHCHRFLYCPEGRLHCRCHGAQGSKLATKANCIECRERHAAVYRCRIRRLSSPGALLRRYRFRPAQASAPMH